MSNYSQVEIGSTPYNVYADLETADEYLDASIQSSADTWRDDTLTDDDMKKRGLVSGTRWLDSVTWLGQKVSADQELEFPRTGLTYADGTPVPDDEIPAQIVTACVELAAYLVDNPDGRAELANPSLSALRAGSVSLNYFRPEGGTQTQTPFPKNVMMLISQFLGGAGGPVGAVATGADCTSDLLNKKYGFTHGL